MLLCCLPWRRLAALIDEAEAKDGEVEELHKKRREVRGGGCRACNHLGAAVASAGRVHPQLTRAVKRLHSDTVQRTRHPL